VLVSGTVTVDQGVVLKEASAGQPIRFEPM
jgi:hypothetical protein